MTWASSVESHNLTLRASFCQHSNLGTSIATSSPKCRCPSVHSGCAIRRSCGSNSSQLAHCRRIDLTKAPPAGRTVEKCDFDPSTSTPSVVRVRSRRRMPMHSDTGGSSRGKMGRPKKNRSPSTFSQRPYPRGPSPPVLANPSPSSLEAFYPPNLVISFNCIATVA
jgi:hypothetical protein